MPTRTDISPHHYVAFWQFIKLLGRLRIKADFWQVGGYEFAAAARIIAAQTDGD